MYSDHPPQASRIGYKAGAQQGSPLLAAIDSYPPLDPATRRQLALTRLLRSLAHLPPQDLPPHRPQRRLLLPSLGVLLVELASARRPIETKRDIKERLTARWAMASFIGGRAAAVLDPHLARPPAAERALEMLLELTFRCMGPVR